MNTLLSDCEQYESGRANQTIACEFYQTFGEDMAIELLQQFKQQEANLRDRVDNQLGFGIHDARLEQRVVGLDAKLERRLAHAKLELREEMDSFRAGLRRGLVLVWIGTIVPLGGLMLAVMMMT